MIRHILTMFVFFTVSLGAIVEVNEEIQNDSFFDTQNCKDCSKISLESSLNENEYEVNSLLFQDNQNCKDCGYISSESPSTEGDLIKNEQIILADNIPEDCKDCSLDLNNAAATEGVLITESINSPSLFKDFYALLPPDHLLSKVMGIEVVMDYNRNSITRGEIVQSSNSTFILPNVGTYLVQFYASQSGNQQFTLCLNSEGQGFERVQSTVLKNNGDAQQLAGMAVVKTTSSNSEIGLCNVTGETPDFNYTPIVEELDKGLSHFIIVQLQ